MFLFVGFCVCFALGFVVVAGFLFLFCVVLLLCCFFFLNYSEK